MIRKYFDRYTRYNPNKWNWQPYIYAYQCSLEEQNEWNELYRKFRMRNSNNDKDVTMPDFYSLERDADQFDLHEYTFTDTFGIKWTGRKGCTEVIGSPDFEGHLYYYDEELSDDYDSSVVNICYEYDSNKNQPDSTVYECFNIGYPKFRKEWIDIANIEGLEYHYYVENHLFKDSSISYYYYNEDGEVIHDTIFDNGFATFVSALKKFGKIDLYEKLMKQINEHFEALKNSAKADEREFYPGCTAEEYFKEN